MYFHFLVTFFSIFLFSIFCCVPIIDDYLLSPPNEVSEGTMKRAPYVCVSVCLSVWAQKSMKNATSLAFLGRF